MVSKFEKDFNDASELFPKLHFHLNEKEKVWVVSGEIDISDVKGEYWGSFNIEIRISKSYPYCVPEVWERSKKIKRDIEWHINNDGLCCVDLDHKLLLFLKRGFVFKNFMLQKVYPYFANQIYKERSESYAAGEYQHNFDGIKQYYFEELNLKNIDLSIRTIKMVIAKELPLRNEVCICGNGKFKNCHLKSVEELNDIPISQLQEDLKEFEKLSM